MKNGIIDGVYYENDEPKHAGVIKIDGVIYYAGTGGKIATGYKVVHSTMSNDILRHGTYKFDESGKLIEGSYQKPTRVKKKKKHSRRKRFFRVPEKGDVKKILFALAIVIIFVGFFLVVRHLDSSQVTVDDASLEPVAKTVLPVYDEDVYLCSRMMERYYKGEVSLNQVLTSNSGTYAPFEFKYDLTGTEGGTLELDGKKYSLDPGSDTVTVDNLYTGRSYVYSVTVYENDGDTVNTTVYDGAFTTAATNRFIKIPGLKNTRDIGGYSTLSGKKVKEGLLIRGSEIDGLGVSSYFLSDREAVADFGFVYDMDLRSSDVYNGNYVSRLGENVIHKFYNAPQYGYIFNKNYNNRLKAIFADLADPANYPMYLHCTHGSDRTGTVVFLLQGILGVSQDDMELEYNLSGLTEDEYISGSNLNTVYGGLEGMDGVTINDKIENYLTDAIGVTDEQIESIRGIFLEDTK